MAVRMTDVLRSGLGELRTHPVVAHVRARLGDDIIVSTDEALLVWEPGRVVPTYAVPVADVFGDLLPDPVPTAGNATLDVRPASQSAPLDPRTPFAVHTAPGRPLRVHTPGQGGLEGAAYAFDDPDLTDYVALDFGAFSAWLEEDDPVIGHPQDPFHRVTCRSTGKHVVVAIDGQVLADTRRAVLLLETGLPGRYYVPRSDVRHVLTPSATRSVCPYKGIASYWTARVGDRLVPDVAWTYEQPLPEALPVAGHLCFWSERTDLTVDGEPVARPRTPWSDDTGA